MNARDCKKAGAERGGAAASWMFDGNTTAATYRAFLKGVEDGDPAVRDQYQPPEWLSGEWAGESISELLGEHTTEGGQDAYCMAADTAYWAELERAARIHTTEDV